MENVFSNITTLNGLIHVGQLIFIYMFIVYINVVLLLNINNNLQTKV
jgi:hypothetical protein